EVAGALEGGDHVLPEQFAAERVRIVEDPRKGLVAKSRPLDGRQLEAQRERRGGACHPAEHLRRLAAGAPPRGSPPPHPGGARAQVIPAAEPRVRSSTLSGSVIATSVTMKPPIELPTIEQRSIPSRSQKSRTKRP